ncbi:MAG: nucleotide exchange factor GrpE [Nanoarchaeota archaeon]|nr:nucleotide exchange factor GrpE [Nanoarchaeota archaeon]
MVFGKFKEAFSAQDEKYEVLYHRYSKIKLENQKLKEKSLKDMDDYKDKIQNMTAKKLIEIYRSVEIAKGSSFKVKAMDKDTQRLLIDINKIEKDLKELMEDFSIEEIQVKERFYDPELHEVASYEDAKGMKKGLVIKTVKKGFKVKNTVVIKPRVVVTK